MFINNSRAMPLADLLSIYDIAKKTGHSPVSIHQAVERLEITPLETSRKGHRYFDPSVVKLLEKSMRKPREKKGAA